MGGKSRKTGNVSRKLIERLKSGKDSTPKKCEKSNKKETPDPFGLMGKK